MAHLTEEGTGSKKLRHTALQVHGDAELRSRFAQSPTQPLSHRVIPTACVQILRLEFESPLLEGQAECFRLSLTSPGLVLPCVS